MFDTRFILNIDFDGANIESVIYKLRDIASFLEKESYVEMIDIAVPLPKEYIKRSLYHSLNKDEDCAGSILFTDIPDGD